MTINYKLCIKKDTYYYSNFTKDLAKTRKDYWTTVKLPEGVSDNEIKRNGERNLMIQIAINEGHGIKLWKKIDLYYEDLEVVRP